MPESALNRHAPIKMAHHYRVSYVIVKRNNGICARRVAELWQREPYTLQKNVHPT